MRLRISFTFAAVASKRWRQSIICKQMRRLIVSILIQLFWCSPIISLGQSHSSQQLRFLDCNAILNDLKTNGVKSKYYESLDYESLLFVDKASINILKTINPNLLIEKGIDTNNIFFKVPEKYVKWYPVGFTGIKDLFNLYENWSNIMMDFSLNVKDAIKTITLQNEIYIKNNRIAVFTLDNGWTETYRATLINNKLRIEFLYSVME